MKIKASWTEAMDGFPNEWEGRCGGYEIKAGTHFRLSALLGPDGEPLQVGYERPALGFDLRPRD
jgi:hypothetical protein